MRLYPPAAMISRIMSRDVSIADQTFSAGTQILVSPWVLRRHKAHWAEPNTFQPNRFFGDNRNKISRYSYLPFGLGHRICIGSRFAMQEAVIALVHLLRNLEIEDAGQEPPRPVMKITVQPHNDLPMILRKR